MAIHAYNPAVIEPKWQARWATGNVFRTPTDPKELAAKPKYYILDMFPYPSGTGLHVGHPEGYTATDVVARYKRMCGFNVLHPMGWDAFGLPAERAAQREGQHPAEVTRRNIGNFRRQIQRLGFSYDWDGEVDTSSVDYYKWTQWIFLRLYERGLAYLAEAPVYWCPALGTVLANEEVKDGVYVETGDPVERRTMKQWMLRITDYAERLLEDLDQVDWPEGVKLMQRNWIGRSTGADITFSVVGTAAQFTVFTTRPDTLFGATYCVLAPEHPLVATLTTPGQKTAVETYVQAAAQKSDLARTDLAKGKTGVFTGASATHPVTGEPIPIWVADYVLMSYGSGAIMAVPAHDERDHEFAKAFGLAIVEVISGGRKSVDEVAHTGEGVLVNSGFLNGKSVEEAKRAMIAHLEAAGTGKSQVRYRLRDWLFSRQRYWGEPFPLVHLADGTVVPLPDDALPVELPMLSEFTPTPDGQPPLARAGEDWRQVTLPDGRQGTRELNTMPQWAGSCWYYLRYLDPHNDREPWSKDVEKFWMPVDLYVGGVEHAVLHLLYARFWHKVLYDAGLVHTKEPFHRLFNQGMILAYSYHDARGKYYHPSEVDHVGDTATLKATGEALTWQIEKMSKSKQNVVDPDDVIRDYGADALRLYELFMGPLEATKPWKMDGVVGVSRFLEGVWRMVVNEQTGELSPRVQDTPVDTTPALWKTLHRTSKKVQEDTEGMRFNTAIAAMMIFLNATKSESVLPREIVRHFLQLLSPYAPHLAEELWERVGETTLLAQESWPAYDPKLCVEETVTMPVCVNGKMRDNITLPVDATEDEIRAAMMTDKVQRHVGAKPVARVIIKPGRMVNIVVG